MNDNEETALRMIKHLLDTAEPGKGRDAIVLGLLDGMHAWNRTHA